MSKVKDGKETTHCANWIAVWEKAGVKRAWTAAWSTAAEGMRLRP